MTVRRLRASSVRAARRRAGGKRIVVTKVNMISGTRRGRMKTFSVTTKKRR